MPPLWRYWPVYILVMTVVFGLGWTYVAEIRDAVPSDKPNTGPILFAGVAVAALAIISNTWSQWQTSRISHALQGLQTLRTDREYLINASVVRQTVAECDQNAWGTALRGPLSDAFRKLDGPSSVDSPSFRDASLFLLNQYEFLAAATRSGAIDLVLMRRTLAGPIGMLLSTFAEEIVEIRKDAPRAFVDLIWLHRTVSVSTKPYLGPRVADD
ncbi:MAG: hypothetical protein ACI9PY_002148 [Ascidiaceihabitans sp.]|jgi:hypothetical protein